MRIIGKADLRRLLPMAAAIEVVDEAMRRVSRGVAELPLRSATEVGGGNRIGVMPGAMRDTGDYGVKLISLFPGNPAKGLSSHIGAMVIFDPETGAPSAIMNADELTAIRTAAASAVATRVLARPDARVLAVIGTGEQAATHIEAMQTVREIVEVRVAGRRREPAEAFAARMRTLHPGVTFTATTDVADATRGADIICTVTSSPEPVLFADHVPDGAHVNAVGASIPVVQEIDAALYSRARAFTDYRPSALAQARDVMSALERGLLADAAQLVEIGDVLERKAGGRRHAGEITLYRSLGIAAQDIAAARYVADQAAASDVGAEVSLD
jgi:ornithine cyclodeaminase/alanine dehydrogenase-like protein (mu-crystallin family)